MRVLLLIPLLLLASCGSKGGGAAAGGGMPPPTEVGVASPLERLLPVERELTGAVEAIESVQIMPRVGGLVEVVPVHDGAEVKAGELLLRLDQKPYQVALASAVAALKSAQARLVDANANYKRSQPLLEPRAISEQQLVDLKAAAQVAEGDLEAARAGVDSAKLNLGYCEVTAPISGRIGKISATVGNLIVAGGAFPGTVITTLVGQDPLYVGFDLDEQTWRAIGQHLRGSGEGGSQVPVHVQLAGEDGFPHEGQVAFADNQIDTGSGSIRVRARIANPDHLLIAGAFARVRLEVSPPRPALLINQSALQSQLTTQFVTEVDDKGLTSPHTVTLGESYGDLVVVLSGVGKSDRIVVSGLAKLFGQPVSAKPAAMEDPLGQNPKASLPGSAVVADTAADAGIPASDAVHAVSAVAKP